MNKKGFTLMEMLGALIVLIIIVLVVIPIVINIVEKTRMNAAKNTAQGYLSGIETYIQISELGDSKYTNTIEKGKVYQVSETNYEAIDEEEIEGKEKVEESKLNNLLGTTVKGEKPKEGIVLLDEKGKVEYTELIIDKYIVICTNSTSCEVNKAYKDRVKPKVTIKTNEITSTKDSISIPYTLVKGTSEVDIECIYGESENNLNKKGQVVESTNTCELTNLSSNTKYYFKLTPTTKEGLKGKEDSGNYETTSASASEIEVTFGEDTMSLKEALDILREGVSSE